MSDILTEYVERLKPKFLVVYLEDFFDIDKITESELSSFFENAEIVFSTYGDAWGKDEIDKVEFNDVKGVIVWFKDGQYTYASNIKGKIVKTEV